MGVGNNSKPRPLTRRAAAGLLGVHPDTVTRLLPDGLGGAVLRWGGHGREMAFDRAQVLRFRGARACKASGAACRPCDDVMFDLLALAEHLADKRHGLAGCLLCTTTWPVTQPCHFGAAQGEPR